MLALTPSSTNSQKKRRTTPNLLPCKIHHSGPIPNTTSRYWSPETASTDCIDSQDKVQKNRTQTAHFRGRKLAGRPVTLPPGYTGLVLQKTDKVLPQKPRIPTAEELRALEEGDLGEEDMGAGKQEEVEVKMLEPQAEFEELVVWGHETGPEEDDAYVRGMEEWVAFAEAMHRDDSPEPSTTNVTT